jgi:hypothetical protein
MNVKPVVKVVSCLTGLFLLGNVSGFAVSGRVAAARGVEKPDAESSQRIERWLDRRMAGDFAAIQATPAQQEQLRSSYQDLRTDLAVVRQESAQRVAEAIKRHRQEVWTKLTPAQREAFRQTYQERRSRFGWNREETNPR